MKEYPRRDFIKMMAGLVTVSMTGAAFDLKKRKNLLSFSTLGCPDWTFEKIVQFAKENGYDGLEIRGIQRELNLPKCKAFNSPANIAISSKLVKDNGLKIVNLGASSAMHHSDGVERKKNLDEAKAFIDLAEQLKCPYIRVFPNDFPKDQDRQSTIDLIVKGLLELGDYARGSGVTVLMESHGQVVESDDLETIMRQAEHEHVGLIWDIVNMWAVTKESPSMVYQKLKKFIRHTHIKDLNLVNGKEQYTLLGREEPPFLKASML